jgi:hypothetical protein
MLEKYDTELSLSNFSNIILLDDIISSLHSSFILGRSTKDNAIILGEIIYHMLKKKKKKGDMVFKLDVEKANDKVDLIRVSLNKP